MFCTNCGAKIDDGVKFCPSCGTPVNVKEEQVNAAEYVNPASENQNTNANNGAANEYVDPSAYQQGSSQNQGRNYQQANQQQTASSSTYMDVKATSIVAYMTWVGFLVSFCAGDREGAKFHMNQALVLNLLALLCVIPVVGWIWGIFILICWILGVISAANGENKPLPLIGLIHLID